MQPGLLRRSRRLHHWVPQYSYYRKPPHEDKQEKQINPISRNKQTNKQKTPKIGRQRNNPQSKGKRESPEKELNEIEASNLSDTEFKVMVIKMLKQLSEN